MLRNRSQFVLLAAPTWRVLLLLGFVGGCGTQPADRASKPVVIFAAASTKEPVEALAAQFRSDTGTEVTVSLGSSS